MKVTIWGINYRPESTGIAPYNAELAEYLARSGCEVSVVTGFPYYPQWRKEPADRRRLYRREVIAGVPVYRCAQYVPRRASTLRRMLHEASFGLSSLVRALFLPRADVYVVVSPPLGLGVCAWVVSRLKRSRYVFHVQDLQPGAAVGLGMVKSRGFIQLLYALERFAYRHAAAVSGIADGMIEEFRRKGVPAERRIYFPNWLRRGGRPPSTAPGAFRAKFGIPRDHLLAVYSGNLGRKQGIEILLETAGRLAGAAITIVIAGAGAEREALAARVAALKTDRLRLLPLLSDDDYAAMLADTDLGLITQASGTGQYFFPSKLLSLLQAGVPVATVADDESELARAVADGGFGVNVRPGDAAGLAEVLRGLSADRGALETLAVRTDWVQRFSPERVLPQFLRQLGELVDDAGRAVPLVGEREPSRL